VLGRESTHLVFLGTQERRGLHHGRIVEGGHDKWESELGRRGRQCQRWSAWGGGLDQGEREAVEEGRARRGRSSHRWQRGQGRKAEPDVAFRWKVLFLKKKLDRGLFTK
jgi:hypothetical protein